MGVSQMGPKWREHGEVGETNGGKEWEERMGEIMGERMGEMMGERMGEGFFFYK